MEKNREHTKLNMMKWEGVHAAVQVCKAMKEGKLVIMPLFISLIKNKVDKI